MIFTEEDEQVHRATNTCFICQEHMPPNDKVRDHCHFNGKYRGAAHFKCNLAFKHPKSIPVFFHNLEGYDSHLFMQHFGKYKKMGLSCIPTNSEKYISFTLAHLQFLDSLNFINEGLGKLVDNLAAKGDQHFHHIKRHFTDSEERKLSLRKGVYPYEWMDHVDKMEHTSLPEKEAFGSKLSLSSISDDDYTYAKNVWKTFHMQTMGDYHDLYLKTDVLLLADVFENFRKKCLEYYALDPAHYYTAPGLSQDAALKMTKVNLELLVDIEVHLMVEKSNYNNFSTIASIIAISTNTVYSKCTVLFSGVRGGVSNISTRYCKANNRFMQYYDEKEKIIYIFMVSNTKFCSNLCSIYYSNTISNVYNCFLYPTGWAMSQSLPTDGFRWLNNDEIQELFTKLKYVPEDGAKGYILEVDLEIPLDKHDYSNQYVPAPEHMDCQKIC